MVHFLRAQVLEFDGLGLNPSSGLDDKLHDLG